MMVKDSSALNRQTELPFLEAKTLSVYELKSGFFTDYMSK